VGKRANGTFWLTEKHANLACFLQTKQNSQKNLQNFPGARFFALCS
jgi:hypothetical protein